MEKKAHYVITAWFSRGSWQKNIAPESTAVLSGSVRDHKFAV